MLDFLTSLPTWLGTLLSMLAATLAGHGVHRVSHRLLSRFPSQDLEAPIARLFIVVGTLVSLMLSLAFAEVIVGVRKVEGAIQREAVAIADALGTLRQFDDEGTRPMRRDILAYTRSVSEEEWSALAADSLGERTSELRDRVERDIMTLEAKTPYEERLLAVLLADIDTISDARLERYEGSLSEPPIYINVVFFGFLITMACFGIYRPSPPLTVLVTFYTMFVGLVLFLIVSLSDPFQGPFRLEPLSFQRVYEASPEALR